ncbi:MAG: serine/arginine repetitive matrix protein 2 [Clostridia bacterium]|nr:serine/arginine repetitive matrix protein 2 [Clostridia bacterium]
MPIVKVTMKNAQKVIDGIEKKRTLAEKAVAKTISDMKSRAPGAIASCVTGTYNIKKSEINPSSTKEGKKAVTMQVSGETIEGLAFTYKGRLLTPVHFGMSPKTPPQGKSYTLTATIRKDKGKKVIGRYKNTRTKGGPDSQQSHFVLMGTGNTKADGVNAIPFQRRSTGRMDIKKMTTLSVPQMIGEEETVAPAIQTKLTELLTTRLNYHMSKIK